MKGILSFVADVADGSSKLKFPRVPIFQREEAVLKSGVFDTKTSLYGHIERLSDPNTEITDIEIANLVVKYFVNYIVGGTEHFKIPESEVNRWFKVLRSINSFDETKITELQLDIDNPVLNAQYQLNMLGCVSTIPLLRSIIEEKIDDESGTRGYRSLDLGTGSGILQVAFYIKARRNGLIPDMTKSVGIESDSYIADRSRKVLHTLGISRVIAGDTTIKDTYEAGKIHGPFQDIGNENIANALCPLGNEPFIDNLRIIRHLFGDEHLSRIFPREITMWAIDTVRPPDLPFAFGVFLLGPNYSLGLDEYEKRRAFHESNGGRGAFEGQISPEGIRIGGSIIGLEDVGSDLLVSKGDSQGIYFDHPHRPKRWKSRV